MIYSYNKSQQYVLFLNFILVKNSMFRTDLLSVIRSLDTVFTASGVCHTSYVDCLLVRSRPPDDGHSLSEICGVLYQNKVEK